MTPVRRRMLAVLIFAGAALGYFCDYGVSNDHFDRLSRARQIAMYGDVPFRDFFDPGYFLTLYVSAWLIRVFGDNLFGEVLLNVSAVAAGTTLVYLLVSRTSRSALAGLLAAFLVVVAAPRSYDYDKVLFFPLGLYGCWRYVDRPTLGSLLLVSVTTVVAGLCRYDSAVYLGAALLVAIAARHWGDWGMVGRRVATAIGATVLMAAPALAFLQSTAGLTDAFTQILTYAAHEGGRSGIFQVVPFRVAVEGPLWRQFLSADNGMACLYYLAVALPFLVLIEPALSGARGRTALARRASYAVMTGLVAAFILRDPLAAHVPGALPLVVIGVALLLEPRIHPPRRVARTAGSVTGALAVVATLVSANPPMLKNPVQRIVEYRQTPISMNLLPKGEWQPIVEYVRDCTTSSDRVLVGGFAAEVYFFSGRGFAAGLPEVFGNHWVEPRYQRRALDILERQSVPIVVLPLDGATQNYTLLGSFIDQAYELAHQGRVHVSPPVQIWTKRGLPVTRTYQELALPCYAASRR